MTMLAKALEYLAEDLSDTSNTVEDIRDEFTEAHRVRAIADGKMVGALVSLSEAIVGKLDEIKQTGYLGSKGQSDYALTLQNMAVSLAEGLGAVKKSIDDKPTPVWRWPQYLYSGIRNTQFQPIDPAVDSMDIGEFDFVNMELTAGDTTETYRFYQGGDPNTNPSALLQATVVIVYTTSTRDVLISVTKTPLVTTASS